MSDPGKPGKPGELGSDPESVVPPCPNGLFHFDEECVLVTDPDEEVG